MRAYFSCGGANGLTAALRVMRTCIGMHDEFYNRDIIKHHGISVITKEYLRMHSRNNLFVSACLDFFGAIIEGSENVVEALKDSFGPYLETCDEVFAEKLNRKETVSEVSKPNDFSAFWKRSWVRDRREEEYFDQESASPITSSELDEADGFVPLKRVLQEEDELMLRPVKKKSISIRLLDEKRFS